MAKAAAVPTPTGAVPLRVPLRDVAPWAVFGGVLMLLLLYLVSADQGATAVIAGSALHEFMHDGRHLLGFPCH